MSVSYRPPSSLLSLFLDEFSSYLGKVVTSPGDLVLVGDFNIHLAMSSNSDTCCFNNLLNAYGPGGPQWLSWLRCHSGNQRVASSSLGPARPSPVVAKYLQSHRSAHYLHEDIQSAYRAKHRDSIDVCTKQHFSQYEPGLWSLFF